MGGIIRSTPRDIQLTSKRFYGAGHPHPGVECVAQQVSKIQTHYSCKTNMRLKTECVTEAFDSKVGGYGAAAVIII